MDSSFCPPDTNSLDRLNQFCGLLLAPNSQIDPSTNPLASFQSLLSFCFQIQVLTKNSSIPENIRRFLLHCIESQKLEGFPRKAMEELLSRKSSANLLASEEKIAQEANEDLESSKNGVALLDLAGNFIWMDENSKRLFESKYPKEKQANLFELMIPFSRHDLHKKFPSGEIFEKHAFVGKHISFSYVVYSEKARKRFEKHLKEQRFSDAEKLSLNLSDNKNKLLFYRFLDSLSSRATLVQVNINKPEFKQMMLDSKFNIFSSNQMESLVMKSVEEEREQEVFSERKGKKRENGRGSAKNFAEERVENVSPNSEEVMINAILLETRKSRHTPNFDYSQMKDDPVIVEAQKKIQKKFAVFGR